MALDDVKMEIGHSADQSAAAIKASADAEIAKIAADADAQISIINEKEEKRLKEEVERLGRQEISSGELESKKIVLAKKKEVLAKAFSETLSSLESAPADKKLEQYKKMVAASKQVIDKPKAYIAPGDKFTAADLGVSSVAKNSTITGGLILESEDGTIQVDMQYKTILQTLWDREMKSLSDILFG
jgi:V/A-type H+/Na+-transporting ATPase subunit E